MEDLQNQIAEVDASLGFAKAEDIKQQRHNEAMQMVNEIKDMYPEVPPSILYTAVLDYIMNPDKAEPQFENDDDLRKEVEDLQRASLNVQPIFQGIEVVGSAK